jgi:hypothetical protein
LDSIIHIQALLYISKEDLSQLKRNYQKLNGFYADESNLWNWMNTNYG